MKLVIVESPNKCSTIGAFLGKDYKVIASKGHIRDLSTKGKGGLGIDIENGFTPDFEITKDKFGVVRSLREEAKKADEVILASDPDREGEAIAWHIASVLNLDTKTAKRIVFHEITKPVIEEAMKNPSTINMNLVHSQETRRMYDRIIGFKLSNLLKKYYGSDSAGRVQSATLKLIVDNDNEIKAFVPQEYWTIEANLKIDGKAVTVTLDKVNGKNAEIHNKEEADAILEKIGENMKVLSVSVSKKATSPKPPFSTSTMQQEAYNRFKFSTSYTQSLAQKLYEGLEINGEHVGLITYLRTDSTRLSKEFVYGDAKGFIEKKFGSEYIGKLGGNLSSSKGNKIQDAHEAIRPTSTARTPEMVAKYISADEAKLYRLIYDRAIASLMSSKVDEITTALFETNGLVFKATGLRNVFKGYKAIYGEFEDDEAKKLPKIEEDSIYDVSKTSSEQKFTKGPARFTEAKLVRTMEEKGIGRPSTYASTIKTLKDRKYLSSKSGSLFPTELGVGSIDFLQKYFPEIISSSYTANMEGTLDKIESGDEESLKAMNDFYYPFEKKLSDVLDFIKNNPQPSGKKCPECGEEFFIHGGQYGPYLLCHNCSCKRPFDWNDDDKAKEKVDTGKVCPKCGKPLVIRKNRRNQQFYGCSDYPKCKFTANIGENGEIVEKVETPAEEATPKFTEKDYVKECPSCHKGHLVIKHGRKVDFLGCTEFPKCKYHEWLTDKKSKKDAK